MAESDPDKVRTRAIEDILKHCAPKLNKEPENHGQVTGLQ